MAISDSYTIYLGLATIGVGFAQSVAAFVAYSSHKFFKHSASGDLEIKDPSGKTISVSLNNLDKQNIEEIDRAIRIVVSKKNDFATLRKKNEMSHSVENIQNSFYD